MYLVIIWVYNISAGVGQTMCDNKIISFVTVRSICHAARAEIAIAMHTRPIIIYSATMSSVIYSQRYVCVRRVPGGRDCFSEDHREDVGPRRSVGCKSQRKVTSSPSQWPNTHTHTYLTSACRTRPLVFGGPVVRP